MSVRLAEIVASLSLATDFGTGMPEERGLRVCLASMVLSDALGLDESTRADVFYGALLMMLGCTSEAHESALVLGDEAAVGSQMAAHVKGSPHEMLLWLLRHFERDAAPLARARAVARVLLRAPHILSEASVAHCEVARRLAERLGLPRSTTSALDDLFERFDGKGAPRGKKREEIPIAVRIWHVAMDAEVFARLGSGGKEAAVDVVRRRSGRGYDPRIVDAFERHADEVCAAFAEPSPWSAVLAAEPQPPRMVADEAVDAAALVVADFADMKSRFKLGHSRAVADVATAAARHLGGSDDEIRLLRRAALIHDLGVVAVSSSIWDKPGPLSDAEHEKVRLHPYIVERVLGRAPGLAAAVRIASSHHERIDGSGYHRAARGSSIERTARVLGVADVYCALREPRAHRAAHEADAAARVLLDEAAAGRLDHECVRAVLVAAGTPRPSARGAPAPAGLSDREVQVLRLLARRLTNKEIAQRLSITPKTVDHHVQHIYDKLDVHSRAAARLFAIEHGLASDDG